MLLYVVVSGGILNEVVVEEIFIYYNYFELYLIFKPKHSKR